MEPFVGEDGSDFACGAGNWCGKKTGAEGGTGLAFFAASAAAAAAAASAAFFFFPFCAISTAAITTTAAAMAA